MRSTFYSPALGLSWQIYRRGRHVLMAVVGYFLFLILFQAFVPMGQETHDDAIMLAFPLIPGFLYLSGLLAYGDADVGARESCIPRHLLTLPASNWSLVFWPMLCATLWAAAMWIALAMLLLRPCGLDVPLFWPAAMLAAVMAVDQCAMIWPFGLRFARVVTLLASAAGIIAVAGFYAGGEENPRIILVYVAVIVLAYFLAVAGLTLARRGDGATWRGLSLPAWLSFDFLRRRSAAFPSPFSAQTWFEFFRNSWIVSGQVLMLCVFLWGLVLSNAANPQPIPFLYGDRVVHVNHYAFISAVMLFIPLMMAFFMGSLLGKSDAWSKQITVLPFIAVRPISSTDLVAAKFSAAAASSLCCYALIVPTVIAWAFILREPADAFFRSFSPAGLAFKPFASLVVLVLLLIGATWKAHAASLWFTLSGRPWLVHGVPLAVMVIGGVGGPVVGGYVFRRPELLEAIGRFFRENLPWILGAIICLRFTLAAATLRALHQRGLVDRARVLRWINTWCGVVTFLFVVAFWLLPPARFLPQYMLAAAILLTPFVRLALAPLMLNWNRHR